MGTGGTTRAWADCGECFGTGRKYDEYAKDLGPCDTCAAHFAVVDAAHAAGVREGREAERASCRARVESELKAWLDTTHYDQGSEEANALRKARHLAVKGALENVMYAEQFRAAGDTDTRGSMHKGTPKVGGNASDPAPVSGDTVKGGTDELAG